MTTELDQHIEAYYAWLRDKTRLRRVDANWTEITTPFLDRHNDYLQLYARRDGEGLLLTDDGYTIADLKLSGCSLDTPKRQDLLRLTLNGFGIKPNGEALEVRASPEDFAIKKHNLVQAMLAVNDLFYLAVPMVANVFQEDVSAWLDLCEIRYTPRVKFAGKSGYDHVFDYVIPKSRVRPERIVQAINVPNRQNALALIASWTDTREVRAADARLYALLNDADQSVSPPVRDALHNYEVRPVSWSEREEVRSELAE